MEGPHEDIEKSSLPQWLKTLQENSWQMELFVSGGAIFGLFQLSDVVLDWAFTAGMTTGIVGLGFVLMLTMLGVKLLTVGYLAHLLLRGYWISLVCLNDVFPKGSKPSKAPKYFFLQPRKPISGNLISQIVKVDHYAGTVYFVSILSTLVIVGALLLIFIFLSFPAHFLEVDFLFGFIIPLVILYNLDLLSFGIFRKIPYLSLIFKPVFWVLDRITLRVLYAKPLEIYGTNINKLNASIVFLLFLLCSVLLSYSALQKHMGWQGFFDDRLYLLKLTDPEKVISQGRYLDELEKTGKKAGGPAIESMVINSQYLKVFIPYRQNFDESINNLPDGELPNSFF